MFFRPAVILFTLFIGFGATSQQICHPVKLGTIEILCFQNGLGSLTAENRSAVVEKKIHQIAEDYAVDVTSMAISELEGSYLISIGEFPLISLSIKDLDRVNDTLPEYANHVSQKIKSAIQAYRDERSSKVILRGSIYTLVATLMLFLGIYFLGKVVVISKIKLFSIADKYLSNLAIGSYKVITPYRIKQLIVGSVGALKAASILIFFYLYLTLGLSFFPWTAKYASQIIAFVAKPLTEVVGLAISYLPNLFYIFVIFALTHYLLKFIKLIFNEIKMGNIHFSNFHQDWADPTYKLVKFIFYALALVMMFPYLPGSSSPAFQGLSVFLGVLISFGSGSSIANIISGVVITYMRPFKVGDRVKIAETVGDITEKNFLVTRIKTIKNVDITIPNSMVLGSHIINYSSSANQEGLILNTTVTIGYDVSWKSVHALLKEAALRTDLVSKDKEPFVLQTALNDFYVSYELNAYTHQAGKMAKIYSDLHQNIQDTFNEGGIEIMSPHYGALRDGNEIAIPTDYRKQNYVAPKFKISTEDNC